MSELALQLIAENKKTRETFLDLGNCGLTEVPAELGELVWLEGLALANEWWDEQGYRQSYNLGPANCIRSLLARGTNGSIQHLGDSKEKINPFSRLARLQRLLLCGNGSDAQELADLSPLAELTHLQWLDVSLTSVADLSPLAGLPHLQALNVSTTQVADLSPLIGLVKLQRLGVSRVPLTDLSPLTGLANLQELFIRETPVADLSPLVGQANLQMLDVSNTRVADLSPLLPLIRQGLPVKWESHEIGNGIYVVGCPLNHPPPEVAQQGNAAILNYFEEKAAQGVDHLYEAKLLIVGEGGAGKTSLLRRLYQPEQPLPEECDTTKGIDIHRHDFTLADGRRFRLNVWDFGGQEIYHATHQFFLTHRSLYVLLDDTRKDHKTVQDEGFKYWLEAVEQLSNHSPVLIFQNEKAGRSKPIDESGIKARFNVKEVYRGNLEQPGAADKLREAVEFFARSLPHIGEALPARWVDIRAGIEALASERPYISRQDYLDLYARHLPFERTKALHLSRYFHDLGVFLHFQDDPLLAHTVILQNTWATEAVFKMLDDETVKARLGRFGREDCRRVWQESAYADMHEELLALMVNFELCYQLQDSDTWLVPQLLPPSKPAQLTGWEQPGDLVLRYRYEFLPKGMVSRLMVRQHRFVPQPELGWASGVLFARDGTELLAEIPAKGREIVLRARGPERKELLSVIASELDALNDTFHGLRDKVRKWVPCLCGPCQTKAEPEFFEYQRLLQRKRDGKLQVECPASYQDVSVLELLDGVQVKDLDDWQPKDLESSRAEPAAALRTVKIFLASSSQLREDRDAFELYFRQQNDRLRKQGLYLQIVRWENFLDAMSATRLQDEYNRQIHECELFVSLFFTKTGRFTEEEFDTAHRHFLDTGKPHIWTYFKNDAVSTGSLSEEIIPLLQFKKKLADLGHFYTEYSSTNDLKQKFRDQLDKWLEKE